MLKKMCKILACMNIGVTSRQTSPCRMGVEAVVVLLAIARPGNRS